MYKSGVEIPQVDFSMLSCNAIAAGSYFIGFNLGNSGKLSKMDCNGVITVIEGGSSIYEEDSGINSSVRIGAGSVPSDYSTVAGGQCNSITSPSNGTVVTSVVQNPATAINFNGAVTQDATSGSGSGIFVFIDIASGIVSVNLVIFPGQGYEVGDTITVLGSQVGGTDGVDDVVLQVDEVFSGSSFVGSGCGNSVVAIASSIVGGVCNEIGQCGYGGFIGGGISNTVSFPYGTITAGANNSASELAATVVGGFFNVASGVGSIVVGGGTNTASGDGSKVGGGSNNVASGDTTTISGGYQNVACGKLATVSGGCINTASGDYSYVGAGLCNAAAGCYSVVAGGQNNTASLCSGSCKYSTVSGGYANSASGYASVISGGGLNSSTNDASTVSGGYQNTASNAYATVVGGEGNTASGGRSIVGGGSCNTASGSYSGILGGSNNTIGCNCSFIVGDNITADRACTTFVNALSVKNMPTDADLPLPSGVIYLCTGDGTLRIA